MGAKLSPHVARAYELLADGEWHDRDRIAREMFKVIPPGVAVRHAEKMRTRSGPKKAPSERQIPRSTEFLIASGKKSLVKMGLRQARIEHRETEDGRAQVRLRPPMLSMTSEAVAKRAAKARSMGIGRTSPQFERALKVLADGGWHNREAVLSEMIPVVPTEAAMRAATRRAEAARQRYEHMKEANSDLGGGPGGRPPATPQQMLDRGARAVAIDSLVHGQRFEHRRVDGVAQVRLRPKVTEDYSPGE